MKKLLILALLPLMMAATFPADLSLSWTNASQYTDGSLIEAGDLVSVRVDCYRNGNPVPMFSSTVPVTGVGAAQSETFVGAILQPGNYECYGVSILFDGTESDPSIPEFLKYTGKPNPPVFN